MRVFSFQPQGDICAFVRLVKEEIRDEELAAWYVLQIWQGCEGGNESPRQFGVVLGYRFDGI